MADKQKQAAIGKQIKCKQVGIGKQAGIDKQSTGKQIKGKQVGIGKQAGIDKQSTGKPCKRKLWKWNLDREDEIGQVFIAGK